MRALPLAALALSACVGSFGGDAPAPAAIGPIVAMRLDAGGIEPLGTGLRIDFGRHMPGVIDTVTRLQGHGPSAILGADVCGPRHSAASWPDGLVLVFRDNTFRGWRTDDPDRSADESLSAGAACTAA